MYCMCPGEQDAFTYFQHLATVCLKLPRFLVPFALLELVATSQPESVSERIPVPVCLSESHSVSLPEMFLLLSLCPLGFLICRVPRLTLQPQSLFFG